MTNHLGRAEGRFGGGFAIGRFFECWVRNVHKSKIRDPGFDDLRIVGFH